MTSRLETLATVFSLFVAVSSLAGCNHEPGERTQLVGQECVADEECVEGLVCIERRCVYESNPGAVSDAGNADVDDASDVLSEDAAPSVDIGQEGDAPVICHPPGHTTCYSDTEVLICREDGRDYDREPCSDGTRCADGECVPTN